ncbi:MAG: hypothetical protein MUP71_10185 [Candidatus Aminicenantes bacterium]|nr:hypothetical protein [Candidatus Aminicenantes bacterium]
MKIIEVRKVEDCFDGALRLEYRFDGEIAEPFMRRLATGSRLDYFPDFPKPFFKIFREDGLQIKGILGSFDIEAYFPRMQKEEIKRNFEAELLQLLETKPTAD